MASISSAGPLPESPRTSEEATEIGSPSASTVFLTPDVRGVAKKFAGLEPGKEIEKVSPCEEGPRGLSATADEFTPIGVSALLATSTMATAGGQKDLNSPSLFGAIGDTPANSGSKRSRAFGGLQFGLASAGKVPGVFPEAELRSRAFCVRVTDDQLGAQVLSSIITSGFKTLQNVNSSQNQNASFTVAFTDIREAASAFAIAMNAGPGVTATYMSAKDLAEFEGRTDISRVTDFESDILITIFLQQANEEPSSITMRTIDEGLATFGELRVLAPLPIIEDHIREFRAEYFDTRSAYAALARVSDVRFEDVFVRIQAFRPDAVPDVERPFSSFPPRMLSNDVSVTGRSFCPPGYVDEQRRVIAMCFSEPARKNRRRGHNKTGDDNADRISLHDIAAGLDVRTTVMLRNIPNKMTAAQLKVIVDKTSRGQYDFMYLRIDFKNDCNVGYAFINFIDASSIITFARARVGRKWDFPHSDKLAELSYATIQGRDCLVEKFRNSSVLLENPEYRPKLFIVGDGPFAGEEDTWPLPNNLSKMRRSVENAEHIGLFAPRQGQVNRSAQRNRRSVLDRGIPEFTTATTSGFPVKQISPRTFDGSRFTSLNGGADHQNFTNNNAHSRNSTPSRGGYPNYGRPMQYGRFTSTFWTK